MEEVVRSALESNIHPTRGRIALPKISAFWSIRSAFARMRGREEVQEEFGLLGKNEMRRIRCNGALFDAVPLPCLTSISFPFPFPYLDLWVIRPAGVADITPVELALISVLLNYPVIAFVLSSMVLPLLSVARLVSLFAAMLSHVHPCSSPVFLPQFHSHVHISALHAITVITLTLLSSSPIAHRPSSIVFMYLYPLYRHISHFASQSEILMSTTVSP